MNSGKKTKLQDRAHWARTYLSKAGLLTSPKRNLHVITDLGQTVLASKPTTIDNYFLSQFKTFTDWIELSRASSPVGLQEKPAIPVAGDRTLIDERQTPEDAIEAASALLNSALRDELLTLLLQLTPQRFEQVILDLLIAMGYGAGNLDRGQLTKSTGDGGIDGIIHEDALGLDAVYIQARRYLTGQQDWAS